MLLRDEYHAKYPDPADRAAAFNQAISEAQAQGLPAVREPITCKSGCSACCHMYVSISEDEAALIRRELRREGREIPLAALKRQAAESLEVFYQRPFKQRVCPFLGEHGACSIYDYRPSACRTLIVVSPAENCITANNTAPVMVLQVELLTSAALSAGDGQGNLSSKLLKILAVQSLHSNQ